MPGPQQDNRMSKSLMYSPYYEAIKDSKGKAANKPSYNMGIASGIQRQPSMSGMPMQGNPYAMQGAQRQQRQQMPVQSPLTKKQQKQKAKQIKKRKKLMKKQSDFFYIMRNGTCFLMLILMLAVVAVFALGFLNIIPSFTSLYVVPDNTTTEDREQYEKDNVGKDEPAYTDSSKHFALTDPISGVFDRLFEITGIGSNDFYTSTLGALELNMSEEPAFMETLGLYAFMFSPFAIIFFVLMALVVMFKCIFAFFGKRIYKRFGLCALLMLVSAAVVVIGGLFALNVFSPPAAGEAMSINFAKALPFIMRIISGAPTAEAIAESPAIQLCLGFGGLILIIMPIVVLLLSLFAKKKIPYSVFDK